MLVVIVVAAAVAFSIFVSTYQAQVQAQETYQHDQALESVHILSIAPSVNSSSGFYWSLNFTMAAEDVNPSTITGIAINADPVILYQATALQLNISPEKLTTVSVTAGANFVLTPGDEATVMVNFTHGLGLAFPLNLSTANYVKIDLYTGFLNDFSRVFIPPSAVILVDTDVLGASVTTILDGSLSTQPEGNATIVSWSWTVTNESNGSSHASYEGEVAQTSAHLFLGIYWIDLTVTNSDDLTGTDNITYNPG
jgi:hypothetical protein